MSKFDSLFNSVVKEGYLPAKVQGQKLYGLGPIDYGHFEHPSEALSWEGPSAKQILKDTTESSVIEDYRDYNLERTVNGVQVWGADEFVVYIGPDTNKLMAVAVADFKEGGRSHSDWE